MGQLFLPINLWRPPPPIGYSIRCYYNSGAASNLNKCIVLLIYRLINLLQDILQFYHILPVSVYQKNVYLVNWKASQVSRYLTYPSNIQPFMLVCNLSLCNKGVAHKLLLNLKVCAPNSLIECFMAPYSYIYITFTSSCHNILTPPSSIPFSSLVVFKRTKFIFQHHKLMNDLLAVPLGRAGRIRPIVQKRATATPPLTCRF